MELLGKNVFFLMKILVINFISSLWEKFPSFRENFDMRVICLFYFVSFFFFSGLAILCILLLEPNGV